MLKSPCSHQKFAVILWSLIGLNMLFVLWTLFFSGKVSGIVTAHSVRNNKKIGKIPHCCFRRKNIVLIQFSFSSHVCRGKGFQHPDCSSITYFLRSCPQAPSISAPISLLIVTFIPDFSSLFLKRFTYFMSGRL